MRNKEKFLEDIKKDMKDGLMTDEQLIECAAHSMRHRCSEVFELPSEFSKDNEPKMYDFELKGRPSTEGEKVMIDDYFYLGGNV